MTDVREYGRLRPEEARALQEQMRHQVQLQPLAQPPQLIGAADISFNKYEEHVYAGIVLMKFPELTVLDRFSVVSQAPFPYVPGLLSFRELPALMEVWEGLPQRPDLMILDGQGIAHPRRLGIASHFGVVTGCPAIGCAKSVLCGHYEEPGATPGAVSPLIHRGETVGMALRSKARCLPVFVSPGHLITLEESVDIIRSCMGRYRIPEPTRQAHEWVNQVRRQARSAPPPPGAG